MRRTEVLQEVRKMQFEEACGGWQERRLTQEEGLDGLVDKRLGQVSAPRRRREIGPCEAWLRLRRRIGNRVLFSPPRRMPPPSHGVR